MVVTTRIKYTHYIESLEQYLAKVSTVYILANTRLIFLLYEDTEAQIDSAIGP